MEERLPWYFCGGDVDFVTLLYSNRVYDSFYPETSTLLGLADLGCGASRPYNFPLCARLLLDGVIIFFLTSKVYSCGTGIGNGWNCRGSVRDGLGMWKAGLLGVGRVWAAFDRLRAGIDLFLSFADHCLLLFLHLVRSYRRMNCSKKIQPREVNNVKLDFEFTVECMTLAHFVGKPWLTYLGGNVCAKILSDPLQLGPRAKTLRQEVHFSYHTQLSDRQELLRSSRNLSQKMTPWHKEHSDGLRSQGSYLANPSSPLCKACTFGKVGSISFPTIPRSSKSDIGSYTVFLTRNKLIYKPECVGKKTHSCTTRNSRIAKDLPGTSRNPDRKTALKRTKNTPVASVRGAISHKSKLGFPQILEPCKSRQRKLSNGTKNVKILTSGARVFPARNKLIREPGCVGKITTPATTWNSRFADSIPRLTGIFTGKVHKNSSDTPTSGSHNSSRPNSDSRKLYTVGKRTSRAFLDDMLHDPF
uniref:Uncharacterized protein n=1 Tax=Fagus sylvatica TaxID=28930 RepID=A0A2N9EPB8_FAGSY